MSRWSKAIIIGLLTSLLGLGLLPFGHQLEENVGVDLLFRLRGAREAPSDVLIVSMDKVSAAHLKLPPEPEKWPRTLHARLTEYLAEQGASVIAFDMIFDEPRHPDHDRIFAQAIRKARNVVLCSCLKKDVILVTDETGTPKGRLSIEKQSPPIATLAQSAVAVAPFPLPKVPVKVSQYWTFKVGAGDMPTLPVVAFQLYSLQYYDDFIQLLRKVRPSTTSRLPSDTDEIINRKGLVNFIRELRDMFSKEPLIGDRLLKELRNSKTLFADLNRRQTLTSLIKMYQGDNSRFLNLYGPPRSIHTIPYYQLVQSHEKRPMDRGHFDFRAKAVFIGLSERLRPEQKDGFHTVFSQPSGLDISGVEIAATAFANLLENMPVKPLGLGANIIVIFVWGIVLGLLCYLLPTAGSLIFTIGLSLLYLISAQYQFKYAGTWYPIVIPLFFQVPFSVFSALAWKYIDTNKERENIRKALGYYLPKKLADQLARNIADLKTSGQIVYGTCLFTDIEQYTTLSESMEPTELHTFMNKYFEAIFEPVTQHAGIVAEIQGDSMLAIWGAPNPDATLRKQACLAALGISSAVHRFNQTCNSIHLPTRIGLHSGSMFLGNVGAIDHYEYRPTGDIVNTASRIEGLNKYLNTKKLVSRDVLDQLDGFLTRELGTFLFVGKSRPVIVHELICQVGDSSEQQKMLCTTFAEALFAYRSRCWEEAWKWFYELKNIHGKDGPSTFYLKLCEKYRESPPMEDWNGVFCLEDK